jgi:hypothetical protein
MGARSTQASSMATLKEIKAAEERMNVARLVRIPGHVNKDSGAM